MKFNIVKKFTCKLFAFSTIGKWLILPQWRKNVHHMVKYVIKYLKGQYFRFLFKRNTKLNHDKKKKTRTDIGNTIHCYYIIHGIQDGYFY